MNLYRRFVDAVRNDRAVVPVGRARFARPEECGGRCFRGLHWCELFDVNQSISSYPVLLLCVRWSITECASASSVATVLVADDAKL